MKRDPRYALWLPIADELERLHGLLYDAGGYWAASSSKPCRPTGLEAAQWIRRRCEAGWWYWWDKTTIAAHAESPLNSLNHVIGDNGRGSYESSPKGREMLARIDALSARIAAVMAA